MARSSVATSENDGRDLGSDDQHLSISDLHAGSHQLGISGLNVPLIIPSDTSEIIMSVERPGNLYEIYSTYK